MQRQQFFTGLDLDLKMISAASINIFKKKKRKDASFLKMKQYCGLSTHLHLCKIFISSSDQVLVIGIETLGHKRESHRLYRFFILFTLSDLK